MATLTRPKLKRNETPQSASFQKRMKAFNRQEALAEVTREQKRLQAEDAAKAAKRDVLEESKSTPTKPAKPAVTVAKNTTTKSDRVAESGRSALENRAKTLEEAIEGGVQEANDEAKRKRKRKK